MTGCNRPVTTLQKTGCVFDAGWKLTFTEPIQPQQETRNLNIGAKAPIHGEQVFLVGRCSSSAEPPFVLLYNPAKGRRVKRNIQKMDPAKVVAALGENDFVKMEAPHWGTVWFRVSAIRDVREIPDDALKTSEVKFGAFVLFGHDPEPPDEHAGFLLYGTESDHVTKLLKHLATR